MGIKGKSPEKSVIVPKMVLRETDEISRLLSRRNSDAKRVKWEVVERKAHLGTYCQIVREVIEVEIIELKSLT